MLIKRTATSLEALPEEIKHVIFLRLPIKSLLKCRAVCKSWSSIISTSTFINTHLRLNNQNNDGDGQLLLLQALLLRSSPSYDLREPFSLRRDNPSLGEYTKLRNPFLAYNRTLPPFSKNKIDIYQQLVTVVGTCNGLVCLVAHDFTVLIWNPCIRKYVILARPSVTLVRDDNSRVSYAFGYDSCTNDYKVLRSVGYFRGVRSSCEVEIWSLAQGSWKSLTASIVIPGDNPSIPKAFIHDAHAFVNGALHWVHKYKMTDYHDSIVSFDMSSESFSEITMPEFLREKEFCLIARYKDSLAFFEKEFSGRGVQLRMWAMVEYGVVNSCTNLFTLHFPDMMTYPLWFRKTGEIVLKSGCGVLKSLDPKTKCIIEYFRTNEYTHYYFMDYFVESLVLLDKPNAISY